MTRIHTSAILEESSITLYVNGTSPLPCHLSANPLRLDARPGYLVVFNNLEATPTTCQLGHHPLNRVTGSRKTCQGTCVFETTSSCCCIIYRLHLQAQRTPWRPNAATLVPVPNQLWRDVETNTKRLFILCFLHGCLILCSRGPSSSSKSIQFRNQLLHLRIQLQPRDQSVTSMR